MDPPTFRGQHVDGSQGNGVQPDATPSAGDGTDDKMEQIRELLYGEHHRKFDDEIKKLETRMTALENGIERRLDALQARLEALSGEVAGDRRTSFQELARGLAELADKMQRISQA